MDASRDGIQKLMTAEKEAQAIVSAAREGACAIATRMRRGRSRARGD
jgi:V-type H+-transporting ATPase subunit G